jgi:precorrin-6Y C5,15-methyltransferase (decarboxylating)
VSRWLTVVGIGDDGLDGLAPATRALVEGAEAYIGGERHLAMLPEDGREKIAWPSPLLAVIDQVIARRGRRLCVLATGDPMCYGIGVTLAKRIPFEEMTVIPAPSAFSLACARLGWPLAEVDTLTLHGRPVALMQPLIQPGARLMALSDSGETPALVAHLLLTRGYGDSRITVLEHMGGVAESIITATAAEWADRSSADFNTIAVECVAGPDAEHLPRVAGLPDHAFVHDGQLTKREVRAATLALLGPTPCARLWDVGAGCGSVAVEWMRAARGATAVAIERNPARCAMIAQNALTLGVPGLRIVEGTVPAALDGLESPDAIFIGGGITGDCVAETCWAALRPRGRLVANAVTIGGDAKLVALQAVLGGTLTRIAVSRAEPLGPHLGWNPMLAVTQWQAVKP